MIDITKAFIDAYQRGGGDIIIVVKAATGKVDICHNMIGAKERGRRVCIQIQNKETDDGCSEKG